MYELRPPAPRTARGNLYPYPRVRNARTRPRPYTLFAPPSMHRATEHGLSFAAACAWLFTHALLWPRSFVPPMDCV